MDTISPLDNRYSEKINDVINLLETDEDTYRTYVVIDKAKL